MGTGLDPRPAFVGGRLAGSRCTACGAVAVPAVARCSACWATTDDVDDIDPVGTVWSSTIVHLPVGPYEAPFGLAYVDLDAGARVLAHTPGDAATVALVAPETRVRLEPNEHGDLVATEETP
jgi:uncharacterized OB-fold protein